MSVNVKFNDQRMIDTFIDLVQIDSESTQEKKITQYIVNLFQEMGMTGQVDRKGNIHFFIKGLLANGPVYLFNAHLDTVVPGKKVKPAIVKERIVSESDTILGADDKAGVAGIIELMRLLNGNKLLFHEIKVIFTVEEEIGLKGAKVLSFDDVKADYCFVLDSDGDVGSIVHRAPAQDSLTIKIKGKAAHAGICPEKGISAIKIASVAIANINEGRVDKETTANIGLIKGGQATNIIAEEVEVKAEARSHDPDKLYEQVKHMKAEFEKAAEKFQGSCTIEVERSYDAVSIAKNSESIQVTMTAAKKLGYKHNIYVSGGGSDASVIHAYGVPTIALCTGMEQVHSTEEYVTLENLKKIPRYLIEIIKIANNYGK